MAWAREIRLKFDVEAPDVNAIKKDVNVQYKWRTLDSTYEDLDEEQCIEIETD